MQEHFIDYVDQTVISCINSSEASASNIPRFASVAANILWFSTSQHPKMSRWKGTQSHRYLLKRRKHHSDFRRLVSQWSLVPSFQTSEVLGQKWCKRSLWINRLNMHWTCIEHSDPLLCNLFVTMMPWNELNTTNFMMPWNELNTTNLTVLATLSETDFCESWIWA